MLNSRSTFKACAASVKAECETIPGIHFVRESVASTTPCDDIARACGCDYVCAIDTGMYDAVGHGLDAAVAAGCDILAWLNADEQYQPGAFNAVAAAFEADPELDLVFGDYLILGADGRLLAARREIPPRLFYLRHGVNYLLSCTVFFRAGFWRRFGGFDPAYSLVADKKFYFRALESGAKVRHLPAFLGVYGSTGHNISLLPAAAEEQRRLRDEIGASPHPALRRCVRALRGAEKLLRGCYWPRKISTTVFNAEGEPQPFTGRLSTRWRWS
ncbi:MAG: hypothetical protein ACOX9C_08705 [Kiritimatiellia bacterium]